jgi:hypothetical protein
MPRKLLAIVRRLVAALTRPTCDDPVLLGNGERDGPFALELNGRLAVGVHGEVRMERDEGPRPIRSVRHDSKEGRLPSGLARRPSAGVSRCPLRASKLRAVWQNSRLASR